MTESKRKSPDVAGNTVTFLLTKQAEHLVDGHRVKVVVIGSAPKGVAVAIAILFKVSVIVLNFFCIFICSYNFDFKLIYFFYILIISIEKYYF